LRLVAETNGVNVKWKKRMPIYEYQCDNCGRQFEWLTRAGERPECPACGERRLTKQLSLPAGHVVGATVAPCPARESGACGVEGCGNLCNFRG
jgi:putative FmdB family regulatory protein